MLITTITYCDRTGKLIRKQQGQTESIPPMPSFINLLVNDGLFYKTENVPRKSKTTGMFTCKCGCGISFEKKTMIFMGKPDSKNRNYLFGNDCAKRWLDTGRKKEV